MCFRPSKSFSGVFKNTVRLRTSEIEDEIPEIYAGSTHVHFLPKKNIEKLMSWSVSRRYGRQHKYRLWLCGLLHSIATLEILPLFISIVESAYFGAKTQATTAHVSSSFAFS
jgi:hypothetical protein